MEEGSPEGSPGGGTEEAVLWVVRGIAWLNVEATSHW